MSSSGLRSSSELTRRTEIDTASDAMEAGNQKHKGFWHKLAHPSPQHQDADDSKRPITKKASIGSLVRKSSRLALDCCSLDQLYRFGGVSIVTLPPEYCVSRLVLPTPFAACVNHLISKGLCFVFWLQELSYAD